MMKNISKKYSGFSLMETMVSLFIFALIMTTVMTTFVSMSKSRAKVKVMQQNIEDARSAMELMAKSLRTSTILSATANTIQAYDYSQGKCVEYAFSSNSLQMRNGTNTAAQGQRPICGFSGGGSVLIGGVAQNVRFDVKKSDSTSTPPFMGRVTMSFTICATSNCSGVKESPVTLQTTVSLRDYQEVN